MFEHYFEQDDIYSLPANEQSLRISAKKYLDSVHVFIDFTEHN